MNAAGFALLISAAAVSVVVYLLRYDQLWLWYKVYQEKLLEMMLPQSADGLYSAFFKPADVVTDKADPAERFKNGEGYSYCKIKKGSISISTFTNSD